MTFAPTDLSGCTVWIDASQLGLADGASLGSAWPDLSGGGHHGTVVGTPAPVVKNNSPYGLPVVRFKVDEGRIRGDGMISPTGMSNSSFTLIYVGRQWGPNIGRIFSGVYPDEGNFLVGSHAAGRNACFDAGWINSGVTWTTPPTPWTTWGFVYTGSPNWGTFFIDGVESGGNAGGGAHGSHWNISGFEEAGHGAETCDCEVAELITYNRALTPTERVQVEDYLTAKWFAPPPVPVTAALSGGGTLSATVEVVTSPTEVTIDHTKVASDLTDFPVYININELPETFWDAMGDGSGIRCYVGAVECAREILADTNELHVKVPALSSTVDTIITIVPDGGSAYAPTDPYGSKAVWSNSYRSVYHLSTDPTVSVPDSVNGYDAITSGSGATEGYGVIGSAVALNGATTLAASVAGVVTGANPRTMSAWVYPAAGTEASGPKCIWGQGANATGALWEMMVINGHLILHAHGAGFASSLTAAPLPDETLAYCVIAYDGTTVKVYLDGDLMDQTAMALGTGSDFNNLGGPGYVGQMAGVIDEARLSTVERSAAWIETEYHNQSDTAGFYSVTTSSATTAAALSGGGTLSATVAHRAALHSTGQLQVTVTVYTPPPPDNGGWSVSPGPTVRKHGPSWTETGGGVATMTRPGGWHALVEKVASLQGVGTLNAVLAPIRGNATDFGSVGTLGVGLLLRSWRDVALGGSGAFDSSPDPFETRPRTASFGSTGLLTAIPNDGLSAIIGARYPAYFSGGGSLGVGVGIGGGVVYEDGFHATVIGRYLYPALFTGAGELTATLDKLQAGIASWSGTGSLSATTSPVIPVLAQLTASGALSATAAGGVLTIASLLGTGTISATVFANYLASAGFSGAGAMTAALLASYQGTSSAGGTGTVSATIFARYPSAAALSGGGTLTSLTSQVYTPATALGGVGAMTAAMFEKYTGSAAFSGGGTLSATVTKPFTPFTETNTARTNQAVPINTDGCWVTLVGGGNSGGTGRGAAFANNGGGGGGGGGGVLARSFIPASALGSTYTVVKGGAAQASSFSSGSNSVTANAGGVGANGGSSGTAAGGTGGTVSVTGFTGLTTYTGGAGGNGGTAGANAGTAGANQTTTSPGGGGGGGRSSGGGTAAGGKGGNSATAAGGTASGGDGVAATAPNPGGGGAGGVSTNGTGGTGGDAGVYGAGGGGGGGGNSTGSGGSGSAGSTTVEWV